MNIGFLDIDGPFNTGRWIEHNYLNNLPYRDSYGLFFDPDTINNLKILVDEFDLKLVISSTWRKSGIQAILDMWQYRNLPGEVIGITPVLDTLRGLEIQQWLNEHNYRYYDILKGEDSKIKNYIIIDDDLDMLWDQKNHFIHCTNYWGFDSKCFNLAKNVLYSNYQTIDESLKGISEIELPKNNPYSL